MNNISRRGFLVGAGLVSTALMTRRVKAVAAKSPFRVSVLSDELSGDFDHACSVVANDFGMQWIEIRNLWGKGLHEATDAQIADALKILAKYNLRVPDLCSPLFKVVWPGAPRTSKSDGVTSDADVLKQQDAMLEKYIALCKTFKTNKIRCFDFKRIDDIAPFRKAIHAKLQESAEKAGKHGIMLILENESSCNTGTSKECVSILEAVKSPWFALNWDPANAALVGENDVYPVGWKLLPKNRIHHCHVKNVVAGPNGKNMWAPTGTGFIDWTAQFRDLAKMGYREGVSLETHYNGATPADPTRRISNEAATRESWVGMKKALVDSGNWS